MHRVVLSAIVFVGACGAGLLAQAPLSTSPDPPVIVATGEALLMTPPDRAYVQIAVETVAGKSTDAQQNAAKGMTAVQTAIRTLQLGADAMRTTSFTVQARYESGGRRYVARHVIEVRVDDVTRVVEVVDAVGEIRAATVAGVRFDLKDRGALEQDALRAAVKDGAMRAEAIAAGASRSLGPILRIQEQRYSSPSPVLRQTDGAAGGGGRGGFSSPIEPGEVQVRAQVTVTWAIR